MQPFTQSWALPLGVLPSELLPDFPRLLEGCFLSLPALFIFPFILHQDEKKCSAGLLAAANRAQLLLGWVTAPPPSCIPSRDGCRRRMSPPKQLHALEKCLSCLL